MKKILSLVLTLALAVALTACGNTGSTGQAEVSDVPASVPPATEENEYTENSDIAQALTESEMEQQTEPVTDTPEEAGSRILVTYFSRTGENYSVGYIEKGNTHIIAITNVGIFLPGVVTWKDWDGLEFETEEFLEQIPFGNPLEPKEKEMIFNKYFQKE